jgi:hypothetical protein
LGTVVQRQIIGVRRHLVGKYQGKSRPDTEERVTGRETVFEMLQFKTAERRGRESSFGGSVVAVLG